MNNSQWIWTRGPVNDLGTLHLELCGSNATQAPCCQNVSASDGLLSRTGLVPCGFRGQTEAVPNLWRQRLNAFKNWVGSIQRSFDSPQGWSCGC